MLPPLNIRSADFNTRSADFNTRIFFSLHNPLDTFVKKYALTDAKSLFNFVRKLSFQVI